MGGNAGDVLLNDNSNNGDSEATPTWSELQNCSAQLEADTESPIWSEPRTSMGEGHGGFTQYQPLSLARWHRSTIAASCLGIFDNRHLEFPEQKIQ
jgi:hypothetical protein